MSYFQQQELLLEQIRTPKQLERYIGIVDRLSGNINLFLDKTDLENRSYYVKYIALSTVKGRSNKLIFYGLYDTVQHVFHIHNGCKYNNLQIYADIIDRYSSYQGYISAGYVSDNKITQTMSKYIDPAVYGKSKLIRDDSQYRLFKFVYSYHIGKIKDYELYSLYDVSEIDDFNKSYGNYSTNTRISQENLVKMLKDIEEYEEDINFAGYTNGGIFGSKNRYNHVYELFTNKSRVEYVTNEFKYAMGRTDFFELYQSPCPTIKECRDNETDLCGIYYYGQGDYIEDIPGINEGYNISGISVDDDFEYIPSSYSFSDGNPYEDEDYDDLR